MGEFRDYRLLVPGSVAVLFFVLTWQILHFGNSDSAQATVFWAPSSSSGGGIDKFIAAIVAVVVTGYSAGFLLSAPIVCWVGFPTKFSQENLEQLAKAFGLVRKQRIRNRKVFRFTTSIQGRKLYFILASPSAVKEENNIDWNIEIRKDLVSEMSLRLHTHAPDELCSFLTRRLNNMYTSLTSLLSIWCGFVFAIILSFGAHPERISPACFPILCLFVTAILGLTALLLYSGVQARREHWDCLCKFIEWDVLTHAYEPSRTMGGYWSKNTHRASTEPKPQFSE